MNKGIWLLLALGLALLPLTGCGMIDYFFLQPPTDTAQELVQAGNRAMQDKDYDEAIEYYQKLKERYPFSPYTLQAELGLADAYFLDGQMRAAEGAYKEFESLHPGSEDIPYVLFQIGRSNFKQFKSIDLPQENITEALEYFTRVVQGYPESEYAEKSEDFVTKCRRFQAEHELFVADFYWRRGEYLSAWKRYRYVLQNFQELEDIRAYASDRSHQAYYLYQVKRSEQERAEQRGSWKQWFRWL